MPKPRGHSRHRRAPTSFYDPTSVLLLLAIRQVVERAFLIRYTLYEHRKLGRALLIKSKRALSAYQMHTVGLCWECFLRKRIPFMAFALLPLLISHATEEQYNHLRALKIDSIICRDSNENVCSGERAVQKVKALVTSHTDVTANNECGISLYSGSQILLKAAFQTLYVSLQPSTSHDFATMFVRQWFYTSRSGRAVCFRHREPSAHTKQGNP